MVLPVDPTVKSFHIAEKHLASEGRVKLVLAGVLSQLFVDCVGDKKKKHEVSSFLCRSCACLIVSRHSQAILTPFAPQPFFL